MRIDRTDVAVGVAILALGALQFVLVRGEPVFVGADTTYLELAESIASGGPYGFNGRLETLLPPGLPAILAGLGATVGLDHSTAARSMAVFATLGFLFSYALIRRIGGRAVAAAACLVVMSAREVFTLTTGWVLSDVPYFAATSLCFWLAVDVDAAPSPRRRSIGSAGFAACVALCLLLRTAAVSLLVGAVAWLLATRALDPCAFRRRLRWLLPALLVGASLQGAWMVRASGHEPSEWPIGGYPGSYLSQVVLVSGNEPELGRATFADLARRVDGNLRSYTAVAMQVLGRHWILPDWESPPVAAAAALIVAGVVASLLRRGGALHDWVFLIATAMLVVWPWDLEFRFLFPLLPLACWYLWRGMGQIAALARRRPRPLGAVLLVASSLLALVAVRVESRLHSIQPLVALLAWIAVAAASLWMIARRELPLRGIASRELPRSVAAASLALLLGALVGWGLAEQVALGRGNLVYDATRSLNYPDLEAARWLGQHARRGDVLMARQVDVVHHHSGHRHVVWFPPLRDPRILMDGIERYGVQWLVVTEKRFSYWRPRESEVFDRLVHAYPDRFRLDASGPRWRVFEVDAERRPGEVPGNAG